MKNILLTTSWDDGHPLDVRIARLLRKYRLKGTFYVAPQTKRTERISPAGIRTLIGMGMEIGSHTLTHARLTENGTEEIASSKKFLEKRTGRRVTAFCYPWGRHTGRIRKQVQEAGYRIARTTAQFHLSPGSDPLRMRTSLHFTLHTGAILFRHNLKIGNFRGLYEWATRYRFERDPLKLTDRMLYTLSRQGGVFHLWGHAWEIDAYGLWDKLEQAFARMRATGGTPVTNGRLLNHI